jgi:hypothetical protein
MKTNDLPLSGFWTWDHSTNWSRDANAMEDGCFNQYLKSPASFLEDYRLLMEMMNRRGLRYLIIWGLFRDCHGGAEAARTLLSCARKNGVRVLAGVGVNAYGGTYWEGNHEFNLATWLRRNPQLAAQRKDPYGKNFVNACGLEIACPSKEENIRWAQRGIRWLLENFDVDGVNLETGDYGVCDCEVCACRASDRSERISAEDIGHALPAVIEEARKARRDATNTYATYGGFDLSSRPSYAGRIDPDAVTQWTLTDMLAPGGNYKPGLRPPTKRSVGFSHWGSQWTSPHTRHTLLLNHLQHICSVARQSGLEGLFIHGEVSGRNFNWRLNYAAFAYFLNNPNGTFAELAKTEFASEFGSEAEAVSAISYLTESVDKSELELRISDCVAAMKRHASSATVTANWQNVSRNLFARTL